MSNITNTEIVILTPAELDPAIDTMEKAGYKAGYNTPENPHRYLDALANAMAKLAWGNDTPHHYVDADGNRVWPTWRHPDLSKIPNLKRVGGY
jgi:hypothetical protein